MRARVVRVAINGYGVIGKRVADAVSLQDDMTLAGIADVVTDYRIRVAVARGYSLFASTPEPSVIEMMRDLGRPRGDLWEVAVWEDSLSGQGTEVFLTYQVHNEAIVVPETIDAIRALTGRETDGARSIAKIDAALGIRTDLMAPIRA